MEKYRNEKQRFTISILHRLCIARQYNTPVGMIDGSVKAIGLLITSRDTKNFCIGAKRLTK